MMSLFSLFCTFLVAFSSEKVEISVTITEFGGYQVASGLNHGADVQATYTAADNETGWGVLEIRTFLIDHNGFHAGDNSLAYAAGLAEGYLTSLQIHETWHNMAMEYADGPTPELQDFLNQQKQYQNSMIQNNPNDPFWEYVSIVQSQLEGLWYGYNLTASQNGVPTFDDIWPVEYLNLIGDLLDLTNALSPETRLDYTKLSYDEYIPKKYTRDGHCSALIKVSPTLDNLWFGHSSWYVFRNMNRIFKHYIFDFHLETASKHMMFSSYPGYLESLDDYYVMDNGLVMLQTTNSVPNTTLYDLVTPQCLFAYQRVRIANALATDGPDWYRLVSKENSGTYNNQYMILNLNLFKPNEPLVDNTLFVCEQIPGMVLGEDFTQVLERGYFGSYNVPAIEEIYIRSGYPGLVAKYGPTESYDLAPRARIFRRDANGITDLNDAMKFLRYNNYENDPIENDDPMWAICSRGDLQTPDGDPFGCYDTKVSNYTMGLNMQANTQNGPTYDDLPPFNWADFPAFSDLHQGMKDVFNYGWEWQECRDLC